MIEVILISKICIAVNDFVSTGQCLVCTAIFLEVQPSIHFCLISIGYIFIPINRRYVIINWYSSTATMRKTAFLVYKTHISFFGGGSFLKWILFFIMERFQNKTTDQFFVILNKRNGPNWYKSNTLIHVLK